MGVEELLQWEPGTAPVGVQSKAPKAENQHVTRLPSNLRQTTCECVYLRHVSKMALTSFDQP